MRIRRRLKLFPIIFELKTMGLTWKRIGHCCNLDFYMLKQIILVRLMFKDRFYFRCPQCGRLHSVKGYVRTFEEYGKDVREENNLLREW